MWVLPATVDSMLPNNCCSFQVKLAISHALAQSTLLGCYEERLQVQQCAFMSIIYGIVYVYM